MMPLLKEASQVGVKAKGLLKGGERLLRPLEVTKNIALGIVGPSIVGVKAQGLLKGCERSYRPTHPQSRYCSDACRTAARRWRRRQASRTWRASQPGRARRREQCRRYRRRN